MNNIEEFVSKITVLDTETTGIDNKTDDIIEISFSYPEKSDDDISTIPNYTTKVKPVQKIHAASSAVHFITDEDVAESPTFNEMSNDIIELMSQRQYFVGHNVQFDRGMIRSSFGRHSTEIPDFVDDDKKWICTLKLSKKLFFEDPEVVNNTLGFLWFHLGLNKQTSRKIIPHSAEDDVYMCFKVLMKLIEIAIERGYIDVSKDIGEEVLRLIDEPNVYKVMPLGKHKGLPFSELPINYLDWMLKNSDILNPDEPNFDASLANTILLEFDNRGIER